MSEPMDLLANLLAGLQLIDCTPMVSSVLMLHTLGYASRCKQGDLDPLLLVAPSCQDGRKGEL